MRDKTDWTKELTLDDDLCAECGDVSACPDPKNLLVQSIEVDGYAVAITCPNYTISTESTKT